APGLHQIFHHVEHDERSIAEVREALPRLGGEENGKAAGVAEKIASAGLVSVTASDPHCSALLRYGWAPAEIWYRSLRLTQRLVSHTQSVLRYQRHSQPSAFGKPLLSSKSDAGEYSAGSFACTSRPFALIC